MGPYTLLLITLLMSCNCIRYCYNTSECQLEVISDHSVYCYGYLSCFQVPLIVVPGGYIMCEGSHSCYKVNTISTQASTVGCYGLYSCAFLQNISRVNGASGGYSMYGVINVHTIAGSLAFDGYLACYNCTHNVNNGVSAEGALALQNSYISVTRLDITYMHLYSYLAFYGGEVHCSWGTKCNIQCRGGNSCENVTFTCNIGATCSVYCRYSTKNELCPDGLY
eukprot:524356_1